MSSKFPYLEITAGVLNAQNQYTIYGTEKDALLLPELENISSDFVGLGDGYLMWNHGGQRAISYFLFGTDGQTPQIIITLLTPADILMPGRNIASFIGGIKSRLKDGEALSDETIDRLATEAGFQPEPLISPTFVSSFGANGPMAYRTYATGTELANIFGFPRQRAYELFSSLLIVPASALVTAGTQLTQITTPVDKALTVVCPPEASASAESVEFSDHLTVTYSCPGFDPVKVNFEVGTTNRYVRINGPALVVNSAAHAGIIFHKRVPYTVETSSGQPIDTYTILINGRTANRTDDGFEITNSDFTSNKVKITVSSTNFSTFTKEFTPEELVASEPLAVVLEPESKDILLRLDFSDGRIVEQTFNIEKNTSEYCQLRAGNFHGFHAHRLMGSTPETYHVDVRPTYQEAPVQNYTETDTIIPTTSFPSQQGLFDNRQTPVAPVMEKAPSAIHNDRPIERKAPEFVNETHEVRDLKPDGPGFNFGRALMIGLTAVVAALAIYYIFSLIGKGDEASTQKDSTGIIVGKMGNNVSNATTTDTPTEDEQADIDYLNKKRIWKKNELKTDKYKALINAIAAGDIQTIVENDYFKVKGRCTNKNANEFVDFIWKAKGTSQEKNNVAILKKSGSKDSIDTHDLWDQLARKRPDKPNTAPRPSVG